MADNQSEVRGYMPLYDSIDLSVEQTWAGGNVLRFFHDLSGKTKLETNLSSLPLPSGLHFESRSLRLVVGPIVQTLSSANYDPGLQQYHELGAPTVRQLEDLLYGSVLSLVVSEKAMIELPAFCFASGSEALSGGTEVARPAFAFPFPEPVVIGGQQPFRVELAFARGVPASLARLRPLVRIWTILDGWLVQEAF